MRKKIGLTESELSIKHSEATKELESQLRDKEKILSEYRKEHGKLELFFKKVKESISPINDLPSIYKPRKDSTGTPIIPVMQISDGHMGSVQEPDEIEGFNEFNPAICESRQLSYAKRFLDWVSMHRNAYVANECAILVTGDLISGDIHDELKITNAFPSPVQVVRAATILAKQILLLKPHFSKITVHFLSEDNHARLTKKPQAKEAGFNSLNYLVGYIASEQLKKQSNVVFNIYPKHEQVVNVNSRQYLIAHGHGIVGWMGIPWYSIERRVAKESMARMQIIMSDREKADKIGFHRYVIGHWHTPFEHPLYLGCGSVSGTDAFDHQQGRYSVPSQSSWMVHPKYGEFNRINFDLRF